MLGRVVYSSGGNYKVLANDKIYKAKPLGIFRKNKIKILVGDIVTLEVNQNKKGLKEINVIINLNDRKNEFQRPNVSNIDIAIIVTSISSPKLNDFYLDKLITIFQAKNIVPILIFTKLDLGLADNEKFIIQEYIDAGYKCLVVEKNKISKEDLLKINSWTKNKLSVLTGQTGVGKSTFLNTISKDLNLKTSPISKSLGRGKHTTRHLEIFKIFKNSLFIDTPGFSSLEIYDLNKINIAQNFFTFKKYLNKCKFNDCLHMFEKNCYIKENINSKRIMNNYQKLIKELK